MAKPQMSAEDARRTKKLLGWLQVYRLNVPEELLQEWLERLKGLTPHEFDISLDRAASENQHPGFAPDPATVLAIAADMRSGATYSERECPVCKGTGFEVRQTAAGKVAVVCHCVSETTKQKIEEELNKPLYHSAKTFARQERRTFLPRQPAKAPVKQPAPQPEPSPSKPPSAQPAAPSRAALEKVK